MTPREDEAVMRIGGWVRVALLSSAGCVAPQAVGTGFRIEPYPMQLASEVTVPALVPAAPARAAGPPAAAAGSRFDLMPGRDRLAVAPGRWAIRVPVPPSRALTLALSGPARALRQFDVLGRGSLRRLETVRGDGELPTFVSFVTPSDAEPLLVVLDVDASVTLHRIESPPLDVLGSNVRADAARIVLVGMRPPSSTKAGYTFGTAPRYAFLRADAAEALRGAFRQVKRRLDREPIALGDASQWNGLRPASDRHLARHISHEGGRDVDLGLPGLDGDSSIRHRCKLELAPPDRATCAEGSVSGLDAERLAYLLALLIDGPTPKGRYVAEPRKRQGPLAPVELVFADAAYVAAVRAALPELRKKRWIHDEAVAALMDDAKLRASPWHTDHVHVRFAGAAASVPGALSAIAAVP